MTNHLYYGDNLQVLREHIATESVDLIYLDPPFNSQATYNVLFRSPKGEQSQAQIEAFEDTWTWNSSAEQAFDEVMTSGNTDAAEMLRAMRAFLKENDMMAYLTMMAVRLLELHRTLKPAGSLYLHCDPTASHYLKILLDSVFGKGCFINEIVWKRTTAHSDAKQGSKHFGRVHDILFFYSYNPDQMKWNPLWRDHDEKYIESHYRNFDPDGRRYQWDNLTGPGGEAKGNPYYEVLGVAGYWRYSREKMQALINAGRVAIPSKGAKPRLKRYLDEQKGLPIVDTWDDVYPINSQAQERLGYPTQKPLSLLERIINASSNPGDVVLDPFCVVGHTLVVSESGLRPIQEIQPGDRVLAHDGNYHVVTRLHRRSYVGTLLTLRRARSNIDLEITPNHPVLAIRCKPCSEDATRRCLPRDCRYHRQHRHLGCKNPKRLYQLEWISAGELQAGDWVYMPETTVRATAYVEIPASYHGNAKSIPSRLAVTPELMEWLGYYAAEGFTDINSVYFANFEDAEHIAALSQRLFGLQAVITTRPYRSKRIRVSSRAVSQWVGDLIGRGAANKKLPEWIFGLDANCRAGLLRALLRSDGSFRQDRSGDASHSYRYGSASPTLAHQIVRLLLQIGIGATFEVAYPKAEGRQINGKPIRVNHPSYRVCVYDAQSVNRLLIMTNEAPSYQETVIRQPYDSYPFEGGYLFSLKAATKKLAALKVYNLEVESAHSYVTATMTVHNCGCGTAVHAAQKLGRQWVGIDVTHLAISLIEKRLNDAFPGIQYEVHGTPKDLAGARDLAERDKYQFQWWAVSLVNAVPYSGKKKGADTGIDGIIYFKPDGKTTEKAIVSVKGGANVGVAMVKDLIATVDREKAKIGVFVTLAEPTKPMEKEAVTAGFYQTDYGKFPKIQILTIEDLFDGKKPHMPWLDPATFKKAAREDMNAGKQENLL